MTTWTSNELTRIAEADELEMAPLRHDGTLRKPVPIWVVRDGDDLYVRSYRSADADSYGARRRRAPVRAEQPDSAGRCGRVASALGAESWNRRRPGYFNEDAAVTPDDRPVDLTGRGFGHPIVRGMKAPLQKPSTWPLFLGRISLASAMLRANRSNVVTVRTLPSHIAARAWSRAPRLRQIYRLRCNSQATDQQLPQFAARFRRIPVAPPPEARPGSPVRADVAGPRHGRRCPRCLSRARPAADVRQPDRWSGRTAAWTGAATSRGRAVGPGSRGMDAFATTGDPGWPAYEPQNRHTWVIDIEPGITAYPEEISRGLWAGHAFAPLTLRARP
ncbi:DUF2255 family protein [Nonomuraea sp. 3N208]|uniref:DUF2255 family protein n=1 Tax=Nonomuraea sp. 3N208 TaxID=3457421 RepID=UPI003FD3A20F